MQLAVLSRPGGVRPEGGADAVRILAGGQQDGGVAAQQAADPGDDAGNIVAHRKQDEAAFRAEGGGEVGGAGEYLAEIQLFAAVRHEGGRGSVALQQGAPTGEGFLHHAMIAPQQDYATVDATMADMAGERNGSKGVGPAKARRGARIAVVGAFG